MALPTLKTGGYPFNDSRNITISVYGTNASNAVTYTVGAVTVGGLIQSSKFVELATKINSERTRRTASTATIVISDPISAATYNSLITALNVSGPAASQAYNTNGTITITTYPQVGPPALPSNVTSGGIIFATAVNNLINSLVSAGQACTCNCNYCTCNCNYCTCNCNYACTCNCNYSDERLKDNIVLIETKDGFNMYSFVYKSAPARKFKGIIAQELIGTKYEHALGKDINGFYFVDYSVLPINFEEV